MSFAEQPPHDPGLQPATAGDLGTLRRWLVVAGVWAVAASAIALIALFNSPSGGARDGGSAAQVARLAQRIDDLDAKVAKAASDATRAGETTDELSDQVGQAVADAAAADESASEASGSVDDLQAQVDELDQRISELEQNAESAPPPAGE